MGLCKKPFRQGVLEFGCGQCMPCRLRKRKLWTHRLMLESLKHGDCSFVTLTYMYPCFGGLDEASATLIPKDATDFIKRLRRKVEPRRIRYFIVGEYGDRSGRPHYHAALFGLGRLSTRDIEEAWGRGFVYVGDLTKDSAQYIAGYVTKKMTRRDDVRLKGRFPEFARMSRKPGIGALAAEDISKFVSTDLGCTALIREGDIPQVLRHGGKSYPLGRYIRSKVREHLGFINTGAQDGWTVQATQEVLELHEKAQSDPEGPTAGYAKVFAEKMQKVLNLETRSKIFSKKEKL